MSQNHSLKIKALGQVGFLFEYSSIKWIIDPYLFDYVAELYGNQFKRQKPLEVNSSDLTNIDYVLITHEHEDHCDPTSIDFLVNKNIDLTIICPKSCTGIINKTNVNPASILTPKLDDTIDLGEVSFQMIPSAHTNVEIEGGYTRWGGYLIRVKDKVIYHAGDTIPYDDIDKYVPKGVDLAFLPINERNFFKDKEGIIGNMTCREALQLAEALEIKSWIPTHWDLFENNGTMKEELEVLVKNNEKRNHFWLDVGDTYEFIIEENNG